MWGKGPHETVMLPSDSSCSNGTSCYCVIEVKFWVEKRLLCGLNPQQEAIFYPEHFHSYLPPPWGLCNSGRLFSE